MRNSHKRLVFCWVPALAAAAAVKVAGIPIAIVSPRQLSGIETTVGRLSPGSAHGGAVRWALPNEVRESSVSIDSEGVR